MKNDDIIKDLEIEERSLKIKELKKPFFRRHSFYFTLIPTISALILLIFSIARFPFSKSRELYKANKDFDEIITELKKYKDEEQSLNEKIIRLDKEKVNKEDEIKILEKKLINKKGEFELKQNELSQSVTSYKLR